MSVYEQAILTSILTCKIESSKMEIRWKSSIYQEKEGESFEKRKTEYEKTTIALIAQSLGVQRSRCSGIEDSASSKLRFDAKTPLHSSGLPDQCDSYELFSLPNR